MKRLTVEDTVSGGMATGAVLTAAAVAAIGYGI